MYWTTSTVLKGSPQYWSYPPTCTAVIPLHSTEVSSPLYWTPSTVLNNLHSTEAIQPQYSSYPTTVLKLSNHSTEAIQPQYWSYPTTVLKLSQNSTEAIPSQYWCYPPDVLNNLDSTEPTLYGVVINNLGELNQRFPIEDFQSWVWGNAVCRMTEPKCEATSENNLSQSLLHWLKNISVIWVISELRTPFQTKVTV